MQKRKRTTRANGVYALETVLVSLIEAYGSGCSIYIEKVYPRAKALQEQPGLPLAP